MRVGANRVGWTSGVSAVAGLCLALGACTSGARAGAPAGQPARAERTTLRVENRNFLDMTIYVIRPARARLGLATGRATTTFVIPAALVGHGGPLRFSAEPIGRAGDPVSEETFVAQGDEVTIIIPPD